MGGKKNKKRKGKRAKAQRKPSVARLAAGEGPSSATPPAPQRWDALFMRVARHGDSPWAPEEAEDVLRDVVSLWEEEAAGVAGGMVREVLHMKDAEKRWGGVVAAVADVCLQGQEDLLGVVRHAMRLLREGCAQLGGTGRVVEKGMLGEATRRAAEALNLGSMLHAQGRYKDALRETRRCVPVFIAVCGEEHPDTLSSMDNLATCLSSAGHLQEALELAERVFDVRRRVLGEEHPDTLGNMHNLAIFLSGLGRLQEALTLEERVLGTRKRVLGEEHVDTLESMHIAASFLSDMGRLQEAHDLAKHILAVRERVCGEEHPDTLSSLDLLAKSLSSLGRLQGALEVETHMVDVMRRVYGEEHPVTLGSMGNLANCLSDVGRQQEALALEECVFDARRQTLGKEHPDTLLSMGSLANRLSEVGRLQEALTLAKRVLEMRKLLLGEEHPDTLLSMGNLANCLSEMGRVREALALEKHALDGRMRVLGEKHPDVLTGMCNMSNHLSSLERRQEALAILEKALTLYESLEGGDLLPERLRSMMLMESLLMECKREGDAEKVRREWKRLYALVLRSMSSTIKPDSLVSLFFMSSFPCLVLSCPLPGEIHGGIRPWWLWSRDEGNALPGSCGHQGVFSVPLCLCFPSFFSDEKNTQCPKDAADDLLARGSSGEV